MVKYKHTWVADELLFHQLFHQLFQLEVRVENHDDSWGVKRAWHIDWVLNETDYWGCFSWEKTSWEHVADYAMKLLKDH